MNASAPVIKKPVAKVMKANASVMKKPAAKVMKANKKSAAKGNTKTRNMMIPNQEGQWLHINTKGVPEVWVQGVETKKDKKKNIMLKSFVMQGTVTGRG